jgi:hypothetical protein
MAFEAELDPSPLVHRIEKEMAHVKEGKKFVATSKRANEFNFFPQQDALRKWVYADIKSRILQSNAQHYQLRGQWPVKEALMAFAKRLVEQNKLKQEEDLFDLSHEAFEELL